MQEAVYHSVPVIGLPFGMDQNANIHNAVLQGFALQLDYSQLDEPALTAAIQKMLNDSRCVSIFCYLGFFVRG